MVKTSVKQLLDIASEQATQWTNIWQVFIFVEAALLTAIVATKGPLPGMYTLTITVGYLIFWFSHGVVIWRQYDLFDQIRGLIKNAGAHSGDMALLTCLAPPKKTAVFTAYILILVLTNAFLMYDLCNLRGRC